jgi:LysR family transcriptional regulator, nitrogen assimilation regulatory protein
MNLRYARTFVTVAELGTVSKAALRLRVAQPALSRQISAFEEELGLKLFDRVGSRLVLTGEGEQLLHWPVRCAGDRGSVCCGSASWPVR